MNKLPALAFLAACASSGLGQGVRNDITTQMQAAQPALSACYAPALAARPIQGTMVLAFTAEASTGQFGNIAVVVDQLNDPTVRQCVVAAIGSLRLAQPQSSQISVTSYPIHFAPNP